MTITAVRQVASRDVADEILERSDVAAIVGVAPATITRYLNWSLPGGQYASKPFPAPDGRVGGRPFWWTSSVPAIRTWMADRPGRGTHGNQRGPGSK